MKYAAYERGIDKFEVGMLCVISFPPLMDENLYTEERIGKENLSQEEVKKRIKKDVDNASKLPAIILEKKFMSDDWPIYKIAFWTRYHNGYELSGPIIIDDFCVWRYFAKDKVPEGTPPTWMLKAIDVGNFDLLLKEHGLSKKDICYVELGPSGDGSDDYLCYPFKDK